MTAATRRAALTALASAPALALPAVAAAEPVDPVFAAIDRHKAVWKIVTEAMDVRDTDPRPYEEANELYVEALEALITTAPLTLAETKAAIALSGRMGPRLSARRQRPLSGNAASIAGLCLTASTATADRPSGRLGGRFVL